MGQGVIVVPSQSYPTTERSWETEFPKFLAWNVVAWNHKGLNMTNVTGDHLVRWTHTSPVRRGHFQHKLWRHREARPTLTFPNPSRILPYIHMVMPPLFSIHDSCRVSRIVCMSATPQVSTANLSATWIQGCVLYSRAFPSCMPSPGEGMFVAGGFNTGPLSWT